MFVCVRPGVWACELFASASTHICTCVRICVSVDEDVLGSLSLVFYLCVNFVSHLCLFFWISGSTDSSQEVYLREYTGELEVEKFLTVRAVSATLVQGRSNLASRCTVSFCPRHLQQLTEKPGVQRLRKSFHGGGARKGRSCSTLRGHAAQ